jgi:hypothetical protein
MLVSREHGDVESTYLEGVFPREAFVAVRARERLDGEMDALVALQIVVSIEALGTLIALEWSVGCRGGHAMRRWVAPVQMLGTGDVSTVESGQQTGLHAHHGHGTSRAVDIGHDRSVHRRKRIGWPGLTGIGQRRLSSRGTVGRHASWRMNAEPGRAIHGRESGLMRTRHGRRRGIHVLVFWSIGIIGGERSRRRGGTPWVHGHRLLSGGRQRGRCRERLI